MNIALWVVIGIVVVVILAIIGMYNKLQRLQVYVTEAWASIDVQLKRKANILPNLVDTLKMQMNFESSVLTKLTEARAGLSSSNNEERMKANEQLNQLMPSINAVAEAYPTLGTNASFLHMMSDIKDCEDKIAFSRSRYNMSVASLNMAIVTFPTNIMAGMMHLERKPMYEITEQARKDADDMRIGQL